MIQQGDVLLVPCAKVCGNKLDHLVLAEGESTGHKHEVIWGDAELVQSDDVLYLDVQSDRAGLYHEEHDWKKKLLQRGNIKSFSAADRAYLESIGIDLSRAYEDIIKETPSETVVPKGFYKIQIVQEYNHFAEEAKKVID